MNTLPDILVGRSDFGCVPNDMNQMRVKFENQEAALAALQSGNLDGGQVVSANFDWEGRKDWGAHIMLTWGEQ